jgi:hypothetical protein
MLAWLRLRNHVNPTNFYLTTTTTTTTILFNQLQTKACKIAVIGL